MLKVVHAALQDFPTHLDRVTQKTSEIFLIKAYGLLHMQVIQEPGHLDPVWYYNNHRCNDQKLNL
jgi:hypothetical protein